MNINLPIITVRFRLTPREQELLPLLLQGLLNRELAAELKVSIGTIKSHVRNIYNKTGCYGRLRLANFLEKESLKGVET